MTRRLLLCVGPHRSGTSVAAAALEALGAQLRLPSDAYLSAENPKGFYEHPQAVALNDEILDRLGATWDTPTFDGRAALAAARANPEVWDGWTTAVAELIGRLLEDASLAAIKDPRICLLAPIWIEGARRAGLGEGELDFVWTYRDPIEAALSQRTRSDWTPDFYEFGRDLAEGAALWLAYTGQFFDSVEGQRVLLLSHRALLHDPARVLVRLASQLGLEPDPGRLRDFAQGFVDSELYRSRPAEADREAVQAELPVALAISALLEAAEPLSIVPAEDRRRIVELWRDEGCQAALARAVLPSLARLNRKARSSSLSIKRLKAEIAKQASAHKEALARAEADLRARTEQLAERAAAYDHDIAELKDELARLAARAASCERANADLRRENASLRTFQQELLGSTSWRITAPLRAVRDVFR